MNAPRPLPYRSRIRVALRGCRFFARHGVAEQERRAGNEFEVNINLAYTPQYPLSDDLRHTISYADLYEIAAARMAEPHQLLETVAALIAHDACSHWPGISAIRVEITKITPPIAGITGSASVEFEYSR